ncbi:hypothetical protein, partial [Streptococcus pneumoniae]|uniref:hypothetical protein n=1 Tax=Streptococcus pneumoniae TaxID=1313 RepID=UPI00398E64C3
AQRAKNHHKLMIFKFRSRGNAAARLFFHEERFIRKRVGRRFLGAKKRLRPPEFSGSRRR